MPGMPMIPSQSDSCAPGVTLITLASLAGITLIVVQPGVQTTLSPGLVCLTFLPTERTLPMPPARMVSPIWTGGRYDRASLSQPR